MGNKPARRKKRFSNRDLALDPAHDKILTLFYDEAGHQEISESLLYSSDPRVTQLLEMMYDPGLKNHSFPRLCREVGLSLGDVVDAFRRRQLDLGIVAMAKRAPKIMEDTAEDAESTTAPCTTCRGTGEVLEHPQGEPAASICPACMGEGTFRVPGHDKARELFFRTMGLTGRKGPLIAQQVNISSHEAPRMEDFIMETEKAMKGGKRRG